MRFTNIDKAKKKYEKPKVILNGISGHATGLLNFVERYGIYKLKWLTQTKK